MRESSRAIDAVGIVVAASVVMVLAACTRDNPPRAAAAATSHIPFHNRPPPGPAPARASMSDGCHSPSRPRISSTVRPRAVTRRSTQEGSERASPGRIRPK